MSSRLFQKHTRKKRGHGIYRLFASVLLPLTAVTSRCMPGTGEKQTAEVLKLMLDELQREFAKKGDYFPTNWCGRQKPNENGLSAWGARTLRRTFFRNRAHGTYGYGLIFPRRRSSGRIRCRCTLTIFVQILPDSLPTFQR